MGRGIKALEYLPKIDITNLVGEDASLRAYRDVLYKVQEMQANGEQNTTLTAEEMKSNQPYYISVWDITSTGASVASTLVSCASAIAGDTIAFGGVIYTGVAGAKADNTEFSIDTSDSATAADLADSITNDTRIAYLGGLTSISSFADLLPTFGETGADGNTVSIKTNAPARLISNLFFTGGSDPDTYTIDFVSETNIEIESINTPGLTTKRPLDIAFTGATFEFTVRSILSVLRWIEDPIEVKVSSLGSDTETDATYTNAIFRGATPNLTYTWTVVKLANVYTLTSTADS